MSEVQRCGICDSEMHLENGKYYHDCELSCDRCGRIIDGEEYVENGGICDKCVLETSGSICYECEQRFPEKEIETFAGLCEGCFTRKVLNQGEENNGLAENRARDTETIPGSEIERETKRAC